ncbi:hypothetical protein NLJ89_g717 [Agrocybe chaxingu]|uniref:F-box domain-containing protein n=1 Tax=Agrocybe chaxingu TaxID=84603 RepID=A0A9W8N1E3_9AGAR|nr:hypothetical protein NLJ89_g717 [Agrocybe chaxingu]
MSTSRKLRKKGISKPGQTASTGDDFYPPQVGPALKHNLPLGPLDFETVKKLRTQSSDEFQAINDELKSLEMRQVELARKAVLCRNRVQTLDTVLSPFRRIPEDVLHEIALFSLPSQPTVTVKQAPLSLSRVCSVWRNVVLSSSKMWACLYVIIRKPAQLKVALLRIREWSKHAVNHPLDLFLHIAFDTTKHRSDFFAFMRSVSSISPMRRLGLATPRSDSYFLNDFKLPRIESFVIKRSFRSFSSFASDAHKTLATHLTFHELAIGRYISISDLMTQCPWSQLTSLVILQPLSLDQFQQILKRCLQLRNGVFHLLCDIRNEERDVIAVDGKPFVHATLQDLFIDAGWVQHPSHQYAGAPATKTSLVAPSVLQLYRFPAMKTLTIRSNDDVGYEYHAFDGPLVFEQFEALQELTLTGKWGDSLPCAQDLMKSCPNVRRLVFESSKSQHSIDLLDFLAMHPTFLPRLSTLVLRLRDGYEETDDEESDSASSIKRSRQTCDAVLNEVVKMVQARCSTSIRPEARLQELRISFQLPVFSKASRRREDEFRQTLAAYIAAGLRVIVDIGKKYLVGRDRYWDLLLHPTERLLEDWDI